MEIHGPATGKTSQHARGRHGEEVFVVDPDAAGHGGVFLPEGFRHRLQQCAELDEAVQLDAGFGPPLGVPRHQQLGELGAQVVPHLGKSWKASNPERR